MRRIVLGTSFLAALVLSPRNVPAEEQEFQCISEERIEAAIKEIPEHLQQIGQNRYLVIPENFPTGGSLEVHIPGGLGIHFTNRTSPLFRQRFTVDNYGSTHIGCAAEARPMHSSPYVFLDDAQERLNAAFRATEEAILRTKKRQARVSRFN
jgi:hypothetical protein